MKARNIVFVHGLFGWGRDEIGGLPYWGRALDADIVGNDDSPHKFLVHQASCGPVSSFHDRACEVFAQIQGTQVDYGQQHSIQEGHCRFVKAKGMDANPDGTYKGFVDNWSSDNPVILVGHSAGAHTCLRLQQLLADDFWGVGSSADWVEGIICISGVLNGSTLTYMLGCDKQTGKLTGPVGDFIGNAIQIVHMMTPNPEAKPAYDFDLEQWIGKENSGIDVSEMIRSLENSRFGKGCDNLAFDLSLQGCKAANGYIKTYPTTYYISIVTEQTTKGWFTANCYPDFDMNPMLAGSALYQGALVNFDTAPISGWGDNELHIDKWRENDGAVSAISQRYPFTAGAHPLGDCRLNVANIRKGKWFYQYAKDITGKSFDHLDPVFGYFTGGTIQTDAHCTLYKMIYALLRGL